MKLTVFRLAKWFSILSFGTLVILSFWFWFTPVGINNYVNKITIQLALNDPETLTSVGLIDNTILDFHSGRLSDYTEEGEQNNLVFAKKARAGLDFYGPDGLIGEELLTWKITAQFLDDIIEGDQFQHDHYRINQISGVTIDIPSFLTDTHQILNNKSINRYLSRLREFGRVLGEVKIRVESDRDAGTVPPIFIIDKTIDAMNTFISSDAENNPLVVTLGTRLEAIAITSDDYASYMAEAEYLVETEVLPGYRALIALMQSLRVVSSDHAGIDRIPQGDMIYSHRLRLITTTDYTPSDIHMIGLSEVSRIESEMTLILDVLGVDGTDFTQRLTSVMADPSYIYENNQEGKDEMLRHLASIYDSIMTQAPNYFSSLPTQPLEIRAVPEYAQAGAPGGYYSSPALDGSRPGIFYINQNNTADEPRWKLPTLLVHEGAPGHHFQISTAQLVHNIPMLRKLGFYGAYVEGWALYAEYIAKYDMGLYKEDPIGDLGRLQAEIFRAVRLVVDTGLHAFSWSREDAILYMIKKTGMTEDEVVREIERYVVWPGQATAYKIGQLALLEMRDRAESSLGDKFDLKDFHKLILGSGAMPLDLLSEQVDSWISSQL